MFGLVAHAHRQIACFSAGQKRPFARRPSSLTMEVSMEKSGMRCPFVYAKGQRCKGHVVGVQGYGPRFDGQMRVRKVRFWCSDKDDHTGTTFGTWGKERMEFYPDQLPDDLREATAEWLRQGP